MKMGKRWIVRGSNLTVFELGAVVITPKLIPLGKYGEHSHLFVKKWGWDRLKRFKFVIL